MSNYTVYLSAGKNNAETYVNALNKVGISVSNLPNSADGLVLCGGGDVSPCLYGQVNQFSTDINLERDCFEAYLIRKFLKSKRAILGICRGMQIINVYFGGTLKQSVNRLEIHSRGNSTVDNKHINKSINSTFCHSLYGKEFVSNSAHHQSIKCLAKPLRASCYSIDGEIEAFESDKLIAVQFHPERMNGETDGIKVFSYFLSLLAR